MVRLAFPIQRLEMHNLVHDDTDEALLEEIETTACSERLRNGCGYSQIGTTAKEVNE